MRVYRGVLSTTAYDCPLTKTVQVVEDMPCLCAAFVDSDNFVTGLWDYTVRMWKLTRKDSVVRMEERHIMRAHAGRVLCVAVCRPWAIIVSGSEDGTAVIWDLNRATYVRSLRHTSPSGDEAWEDTAVRLVAINSSTGYIATYSKTYLCLHTVNGRLMVKMDLTSVQPSEGLITSMAFQEREYSRLGVLATGTNHGTINLRTWTWAKDDPESGNWDFKTLRTLKCRPDVDKRTPKITALAFVGESLYHGQDGGQTYSWNLPD